MKKLDDREIAIDALMLITEEDGYNNISLRTTLKEHEDLTFSQKKFITMIVNGTLRNLILIDYIIDQFSNTKTTKMKPLILAVLRISVYQILYMDKVPKSAISNTAVNITKKRGYKGLSGFVNGVIRNIIRKEDEISYPDKEDSINYLSIMYSYPVWIIKYWLNVYDFETVEKICIENNNPPKISACLNTAIMDRQEIIKILEEDDVIVLEDETEPNIVYISNTNNIVKLKAFKEGLFHIMDKSSMEAINVLNPTEHTSILDMCSAPGGKSFYASIKTKNTTIITANDIHEHKLELIDNSAKRLHIKNITTSLSDGTIFNESYREKFDYVILDAPCSCLGLIKKRPDVKYQKEFKDIKALVSIQRKMLENASKYVKPDGKILYSTCTISPKENVENVTWFIENHEFQIEEIHQILPGIDGVTSDGFFISLLKKKV